MKNFLFLIIAISFFFVSCKENDEVQEPTCDIVNPLETIQWLKDTHFAFQASASPQATKIVQYTYQGECVFFIDNCVSCPDSGQTVYNELQEIICEFGTIASLNTCPDFFDEATDEVILWGN